MNKLKITFLLILLLTALQANAGFFDWLFPQEPAVGGGLGTLNQLDQWKATSTPVSGITPNVAGKTIYAPYSDAYFNNLFASSTSFTTASTTDLTVSGNLWTSLTQNSVPFIGSDGLLTESANFTYDGTDFNVGDYTAVEDTWDKTQSAGWMTGFSFNDNGDGSFDVAPGTGILKKTNSVTGENIMFSITASTTLWGVNQEDDYVYVNYNGGSPLIATSSTNVANGNTIFNLGQVFREGTDLHFFRAGQVISNIPQRVISRINADGNIQLTSGGLVAETGERYLTVTEATLWGGITRFIAPSINTSGSDTFEYYKLAAGGGYDYYNETATQIDNAVYDDGDGTPANLTSNRYRTDWAYLTNDGDLIVILGTNNDTLADAQAEDPPTSVPPHADFATIIAKIIVQQGGTNLTEVGNLQGSLFSSSGVVIHNETTDLQGGTTDEYYHLTSAEYTGTGTGNFVRLDAPTLTGTSTMANLDISGNLTVAGTIYGSFDLVSSGNMSVGGTLTMGDNIILNGNWLSGDGGDEGVFVSSTGKVGIGMANPSAKIQVKNGSDDNLIIRVDGTDTDSEYISLGVSEGWGVIQAGGVSSTDTGLLFRTANNGTETDRMVLTNTGNLGIGTTNPTALLHAVQTSTTGNTGWFYRDLASGSTNSAVVQITNANAGDDQDALDVEGDVHIDDSIGLGKTPSGDGKLSIEYTSITNPAIRITGNASSSKGTIHLRGDAGTNNFITFTENAVADRWSIGTDDGDSSFYFREGTVLSSDNRLVLQNGGNVGIGTTAPAGKLDVNGLALMDNATTTQLTSTTSWLGNILGGTWLGDVIGIAKGGTGASSLTDHGVLVGSGTDAITALSVGTDGQLLVGSTGADPVFATLSADRSLTATLGAGTIEIDADAETYTGKHKIAFETPTADDDFFFGEVATAQTFTSIYCKTLVGTVDLDVSIGGSDINGTDITCTTDGVLDDSLGGDTAGAVGEEIKLLITSVASDPTYLMVQLNYTYDD